MSLPVRSQCCSGPDAAAAVTETLAALAGVKVSSGQVAHFQECMRDALRSGAQVSELAVQLLQGFVSTNGCDPPAAV